MWINIKPSVVDTGYPAECCLSFPKDASLETAQGQVLNRLDSLERDIAAVQLMLKSIRNEATEINTLQKITEKPKSLDYVIKRLELTETMLRHCWGLCNTIRFAQHAIAEDKVIKGEENVVQD